MHGDCAGAEPSVVQQLEVESQTPGKCRLAAAHDHGAQEQHALVDQPVPERLGPDGGAADALSRARDAATSRMAYAGLSTPSSADPAPIFSAAMTLSVPSLSRTTAPTSARSPLPVARTAWRSSAIVTRC